MAYPLLNPGQPAHPLRIDGSLCALAVMSKAPRAGKVKTRLSPPLSLPQTAALNVCFLKDTTLNLAAVDGAQGLVCYTPVGDEDAFHNLLPDGFALVPQRGDGFGERLFAAATDILSFGFGSVCLIDSDSPTVPHSAFQTAVAVLARPGERVVLGPSHDGGYYLIGLKTARAEPFADIAWSTADVAEQTRERCRAASLELIELPLWYDVDDAATLALLNRELLSGLAPEFTTEPGYAAAHTREFLLELDAPSELVPQLDLETAETGKTDR